MQMVERSVIFGFPHKLGIKVSNYFLIDRVEYKTSLPLPVVRWFLKALKIVPSDTRAPEESAWLLADTSNVIMPAQVLRCVAESTCVVVAYTSKASDKPEFMSLLGTTIADMDCFCIIDWQEWYEAIDHGCLCAVANSEGEIDGEEGEEVDGLDQPVDAPVAGKRKPSDTTPRANKKGSPQNNHPSAPLPWQLWLQRPSKASLLPGWERNEFPIAHFHALIS